MKRHPFVGRAATGLSALAALPLAAGAADFMNFTQGGQPVVDAAFLAHALLRAPTQLWVMLPAATQAQLVQALQSTRVISAVSESLYSRADFQSASQ